MVEAAAIVIVRVDVKLGLGKKFLINFIVNWSNEWT